MRTIDENEKKKILPYYSDRFDLFKREFCCFFSFFLLSVYVFHRCSVFFQRESLEKNRPIFITRLLPLSTNIVGRIDTLMYGLVSAPFIPVGKLIIRIIFRPWDMGEKKIKNSYPVSKIIIDIITCSRDGGID